MKFIKRVVPYIVTIKYTSILTNTYSSIKSIKKNYIYYQFGFVFIELEKTRLSFKVYFRINIFITPKLITVSSKPDASFLRPFNGRDSPIPSRHAST